MPKRTRRSQSDTTALVLRLTKSRPITPQDLASELKVTPNRARQVLEALRDSDQLEIVGKTKGGRGKPANIYGIPGTKLKPADLAPRAGKAAKAKAIAPTPSSDGSAIEAFLNAIATRGLEVVGPAGITFTVRLGGARATSSVGAAPQRRRGRPVGSRNKAMKRRPGRPPKSAAASKPVKAKRKVAIAAKAKGPKRAKPAAVKAPKPVKPAKVTAPKARPAPSKVKVTTPAKPKPTEMAPKPKGSMPAKAKPVKKDAPKSPKLELVSPAAKKEEAKESTPNASPEAPTPVPGGGG